LLTDKPPKKQIKQKHDTTTTYNGRDTGASAAALCRRYCHSNAAGVTERSRLAMRPRWW